MLPILPDIWSIQYLLATVYFFSSKYIKWFKYIHSCEIKSIRLVGYYTWIEVISVPNFIRNCVHFGIVLHLFFLFLLWLLPWVHCSTTCFKSIWLVLAVWPAHCDPQVRVRAPLGPVCCVLIASCFISNYFNWPRFLNVKGVLIQYRTGTVVMSREDPINSGITFF